MTSGKGDRTERDEDAMIGHDGFKRRTALGRGLMVSALACALTAAGVLLFADGVACAAGAKAYATPEQAADDLAAAWRSGQQKAILAILGPAAGRLVSSGDPVAEREARQRLASSYADAHRIETEKGETAVIVLGKNEWPYPIPLVKIGANWRFDVSAGLQEIIDRRIGRDETNAIGVCRAYVEARREYAASDPLGDGSHAYALKLGATDGKRDGLYWPAENGAPQSPFGPLVAAAASKGFQSASVGGREPYEGYDFKILTRQGKSAPGGAQDYVVDGRLTGGFALVAYPTRYGDSGVMTFIVNQSGIVFEKNSGPAPPRSRAR